MLKKIINKVKREIHYIQQFNIIIKQLKVKQKNNKKSIIYIGSPLHGNIGDHAISIAIMDLLKDMPYPVIEIPGIIYTKFFNKIMKYVNSEDIVMITGGGLIGNLWMNEEQMVKKVVCDFSQNKIIIMPETVYFDNNEIGKQELQSFIQVINSHSNLHFLLREKNSYDLCKKLFPHMQGLYLTPDVVLTMQLPSNEKRKGILLVLREDKEKELCLSDALESLDNTKKTTTVLKQDIYLNQRKQILVDKLKEFQTSKLVITDRLHGMIFAAITNTPCIAFDNKSKKVSGVYEWLKECKYICFCDDVKDLEKCIDKLAISKEYTYPFSKKYTIMIKEILETIL